MKKLTSTFLTLVLLTQIVPAVAAKRKGDWNFVKSLANSSVAIRTTDGRTYYGLARSVDDAGITVQIAGKDDFTAQEVVFRRDEIQKLWRAKLRFDEKNIAKGALVGAGAGVAAALLTAVALAANGSDDAPIGVGLFPFYGAAIGAVAGTFWKKKHKKQELIYSI